MNKQHMVAFIDKILLKKIAGGDLLSEGIYDNY